MIVYHGTDNLSAENIIKNGIDLDCGEDSVDNGKGFYTTPNFEFALKRAEATADKKRLFSEVNVYPVVLEIDFEIPEDSSNISIKEFEDVTYAWKEFIFYNRVGAHFLRKWKIKTNNHNLDAKYDIVIDETADNGVASIVSSLRYEKDEFKIKEYIDRIDKSSYQNWDKQISIHSEKGLSCVKSIKKRYSKMNKK